MKFRKLLHFVGMAAIGLIFTQLAVGASVGNVFTYQGHLVLAGVPVTGTQDFQFGLYSAASAGTQVGTTTTLTAVPVANGLFSVPLNFGTGAFGDEARYLAISVRPGGSLAAYSSLAPRFAITPAPVSLSVAAQGVDNMALSQGSVTRDKLNQTFSQYTSAYATFNQFIFPGQQGATSILNFDTVGLSKNMIYFPFTGAIIQETGLYRLSVRLSLQVMAPGATTLNLYVNGAQVTRLWNTELLPAGSQTLTGNELLQVNAGDIVTVVVTQPDGQLFASYGDVNKSTSVTIVRVD